MMFGTSGRLTFDDLTGDTTGGLPRFGLR